MDQAPPQVVREIVGIAFDGFAVGEHGVGVVSEARKDVAPDTVEQRFAWLLADGLVDQAGGRDGIVPGVPLCLLRQIVGLPVA